jgi:type III pantothenate kinase|tara:strand:- start:6390 stop:7109 length:720 start_codon:yes stop_codon:yes gene_type:complete
VNLVLDVGNSLLKIALFEKSELIQKFKFSENYKRNIEDIISNYKVTHSIISNVGRIDDSIINILKESTNLLLVSNQLKIPFKNLYKSKNTLGQDRLALVSAAAFNFPNENVLIVDVGSCITYDFKNNNNEYLGGGISPGISMRFKSLNTFTSNLPLIDFDSIYQLIGNNTKNSITSGVVNGTISEINGIIQQYREEFKNIRIILTGGDSNFLLKRIKNTIFADRNFLLIGLNKLLEDNS